MKTAIVLIIISCITGFAVVGSASTATFVTASGVKDAARESVSDSAIFSLANPSWDGQNLTGMRLAEAGLDGSTLTSAYDDLISISPGGSKTDLTTAAVSKSNDLSHWTAATSLGELTLTTIGAGNMVSGLQFGFGTAGTRQPNASLGAATAPTPEPGTLWLAGLSFLLIGISRQRKRITFALARRR